MRCAWRSGLLCVLTCLAGAAAPRSGAQTPATRPTTRPAAAPKVLAEFDVAAGGEPIIVPVRLDGKAYPFLFDTAASVHVFDVALKPKLGPVRRTVQIATADGKGRQMELFDTPDAAWGPVRLAGTAPAACLDMNLFRQMLGRDLRGVLGFAAMKRHVVQIDFDGGKLRLMAPVGRARRPEWGVALNIETGRFGLPHTTVDIAGKGRYSCLIDTGMQDAGEMPPGLFNAYVRQHKLKTAETLAAGAGSVHKNRSARIPEFRLGPLRYKGLIFDESPRLAAGLGVLSRHLVTFDFPNGRLYLKPGKGFDRVDEINMSGLALVRRPAGTVVFALRSDSPAKRAGVRAGDTVLTINGKPAGSYSMAALFKLLRSGHGRKIALTVRRGQEELKVEFALVRQI